VIVVKKSTGLDMHPLFVSEHQEIACLSNTLQSCICFYIFTRVFVWARARARARWKIILQWGDQLFLEPDRRLSNEILSINCQRWPINRNCAA